MSAGAYEFAELQDLLELLCEDRADSRQLARIQELAQASPAAMQLYVDYLDQHARLLWRFRRFAVEALSEPLAQNPDAEALTNRPIENAPLKTAVGHPVRFDATMPESGSGILDSEANDGFSLGSWFPSRFSPMSIFVLVAMAAIAVAGVLYFPSLLTTSGDVRERGEIGSASPSVPSQKLLEFELDDLEYVMPPSVAQVVGFRNAVWSSGAPAPMIGAFLEPGQQLELLSGSAELYFDSGAVVILEGPAKFEPVSRNQAYLHHGRLVAKVPQAAIGFWVDTPSIQVIDLGTEFGIEVDSKKNANVHVLSGAVVAQPNKRGKDGATGELRRIENQQSVRFNALHFRFDQTEIDGSLFSQLLNQTERTPVIAAAVPNNGRPYRVILGGLNEDAVAYIDRRFQWNGIDRHGIPPELIGADYVQTANDDKISTDFELRLMVAVPATLYVFFDPRINKIPDWLSRDFIKTELTIGLDVDMNQGKLIRLGTGPGDDVELKFSVWKRHVMPGTVSLGPTASGGPCHYGVAAAPDRSVL